MYNNTPVNPVYNPSNIPAGGAGTSQIPQLSQLISGQGAQMASNPTNYLMNAVGNIQQQIQNAPGNQLLTQGALSQSAQLPAIAQGISNVAQQSQNVVNSPGGTLGSSYMAPAYQPGGSGQPTQFSDVPTYAGDPALGVPALPAPALPVMTQQSLAAAPGGFVDPALGQAAAVSNQNSAAGIINLLSGLYGANTNVVNQGVANSGAFAQANVNSQELGLNFLSSMLPYLMISGAMGGGSQGSNPLSALMGGGTGNVSNAGGQSSGNLFSTQAQQYMASGKGPNGKALNDPGNEKILRAAAQQQIMNGMQLANIPFAAQYGQQMISAAKLTWDSLYPNATLGATPTPTLTKQAQVMDKMNTMAQALSKIPDSAFGVGGGTLNNFLYSGGMQSLMDPNVVNFMQALNYIRSSGDAGLAGVRGAASPGFLKLTGSTFGAMTMSKQEMQTTINNLLREMKPTADATAVQDGYDSMADANQQNNWGITGY